MVSSKNFRSTPCCQRATFLSSLWGCRVLSCRVTRRKQARTTRRLRAGTGRAEDDARSGATCPCGAACTGGGQRANLRGWEGDLGSKRCCPPPSPPNDNLAFFKDFEAVRLLLFSSSSTTSSAAATMHFQPTRQTFPANVRSLVGR